MDWSTHECLSRATTTVPASSFLDSELHLRGARITSEHMEAMLEVAPPFSFAVDVLLNLWQHWRQHLCPECMSTIVSDHDLIASPSFSNLPQHISQISALAALDQGQLLHAF